MDAAGEVDPVVADRCALAADGVAVDGHRRAAGDGVEELDAVATDRVALHTADRVVQDVHARAAADADDIVGRIVAERDGVQARGDPVPLHDYRSTIDTADELDAAAAGDDQVAVVAPLAGVVGPTDDGVGAADRDRGTGNYAADIDAAVDGIDRVSGNQHGGAIADDIRIEVDAVAAGHVVAEDLDRARAPHIGVEQHGVAGQAHDATRQLFVPRQRRDIAVVANEDGSVDDPVGAAGGETNPVLAADHPIDSADLDPCRPIDRAAEMDARAIRTDNAPTVQDVDPAAGDRVELDAVFAAQNVGSPQYRPPHAAPRQADPDRAVDDRALKRDP